MEFTVRLYKFNIMLSLRPKSSNGLVLLFEVLIFMYEALCNKPNTLISVVHRPRSGQSRLIAEVSSSHAITPTPTPTLSLSRYDCSKRVLSSLQRPLPTQHITNMPSARFEPVIPSIKRAAEQRVGAHSLCRVISALWDELETIWKVASVV